MVNDDFAADAGWVKGKGGSCDPSKNVDFFPQKIFYLKVQVLLLRLT